MPHVLFEWEGHEHLHEERGSDWYWALGIIATGAAITAILFGDVLFGLVIILAAIAIALQATKRPTLHRFMLTDEGLQIGGSLYHYDTIQSFSMIEYLDETLPPSLSIKTSSILAPHLLIPLEGVDADEVFEFMESHIPHEHHKPTLADHLMGWLRI